MFWGSFSLPVYSMLELFDLNKCGELMFKHAHQYSSNISGCTNCYRGRCGIFLGWCEFLLNVGNETQLPPTMTDREAAIFYAFFFFLEVDESALDDCRRGRLTESKVGRPLTPTPQSTVGPGQRGRRLCVLLRCRVWSEGNGQKGRKSLACGMAQNELLPSFCSSASQ